MVEAVVATGGLIVQRHPVLGITKMGDNATPFILTYGSPLYISNVIRRLFIAPDPVRVREDELIPTHFHIRVRRLHGYVVYYAMQAGVSSGLVLAM